MTSLLTEDCSMFLPPQHKTLGRRLFEDVSAVRQDPLMTQNANVVDLERRRHAVDCQSDMFVRDPSDTETRVLPAWTIFTVVHEADADSEVEAWSGHTDSHSTLVVPTVTGVVGTTGDQPMLHSRLMVVTTTLSQIFICGLLQWTLVVIRCAA